MKRFTNILTQSIDRLADSGVRSAARGHGRRSFLEKTSRVLLGAAVVGAVLPFDRRVNAATIRADGDTETLPEDICSYWRHCALDGFLCSTAGGTSSSCPPGSTVSAVAWIGTCTNPDDGKDYLVSYNDCCGKPLVDASTYCYTSQGERPGYRMGLYNDINWCMANTEKGYHCTVAVVVSAAK
ncbi:MAG TPA: amine dehydrogenase [Gammaproteobacteria bacterium]|jgi:methylamine dehydrogenase light chain|nr:amine dehydrogenase [Gammaproteobacteria bacterium]